MGNSPPVHFLKVKIMYKSPRKLVWADTKCLLTRTGQHYIEMDNPGVCIQCASYITYLKRLEIMNNLLLYMRGDCYDGMEDKVQIWR